MSASFLNELDKVFSKIDWAEVLQDALPMIVATIVLTILAAIYRVLKPAGARNDAHREGG